MLKAIAFGIAAGAGVQAWRNWPSDGPVSTRSGILVLIVAVCCAYAAGRYRGRGGASASAVAVASAQATATAENRVQVAIVVPGQGATPTGVQVPNEAVSWFNGERQQVTADDLDGIDVSELVGSEALEVEP